MPPRRGLKSIIVWKMLTSNLSHTNMLSSKPSRMTAGMCLRGFAKIFLIGPHPDANKIIILLFQPFSIFPPLSRIGLKRVDSVMFERQPGPGQNIYIIILTNITNQRSTLACRILRVQGFRVEGLGVVNTRPCIKPCPPPDNFVKNYEILLTLFKPH